MKLAQILLNEAPSKGPVNPYAAMAARQAVANAQNITPQTTPQTAPIARKVDDFFAAMEIGHPGNRAKVCTGIANTMNRIDLEEALRRLLADRAEYVAKLTELNAPEIIIINAHKKHQPAIRILQRVLANRP